MARLVHRVAGTLHRRVDRNFGVPSSMLSEMLTDVAQTLPRRRWWSSALLSAAQQLGGSLRTRIILTWNPAAACITGRLL